MDNLTANKNLRQTEYAILGAGIAGLGAALKCRELNQKYIVFEKNKTAGGLLDSINIDNFRFDKAVHLSFAKEDKVREIFDKTPYITHSSESQCFDNNLWLKHPVQNNLFKLEPKEKVRLIESFLERPDKIEVEANYKDWLVHQYGDELAKKYPIVYTNKYWCTPPEDLSVNWIGNRMRRSKVDEILFGAFTDKTPNDYYTQEMRYPLKGGYKGFIEPLIRESNINFEFNVNEINNSEKVLSFENGDSCSYKFLLNTLPLPYLIRIMKTVPENVRAAANKLITTSIDLISVGFKEDLIGKDKLWFYIYDEDIYACRAYSPSVKSKDNVPLGCSSIQFEIYSQGQMSKYSSEDLFDNTKYALSKLNIASENQILFMQRDKVEYANVIFYNGMEADRKLVLDFLFSEGIRSCGRFGEWAYLWSNQSLLSGYNVI
jgi:protoporphyrinogen oxidase